MWVTMVNKTGSILEEKTQSSYTPLPIDSTVTILTTHTPIIECQRPTSALSSPYSRGPPLQHQMSVGILVRQSTAGNELLEDQEVGKSHRECLVHPVESQHRMSPPCSQAMPIVRASQRLGLTSMALSFRRQEPCAAPQLCCFETLYSGPV